MFIFVGLIFTQVHYVWTNGAIQMSEIVMMFSQIDTSLELK